MTNLSYISPFFIVKNLQLATSFYVEQLGFEIQFISPGAHPVFAIVGRDNIAIFLKEIGMEVLPKPNHTVHAYARWDAYISTQDPDCLYHEFQQKKLGFHKPLQDDEDGLRGFEMADADGYILFFGRPKN